MSSSGTASLSSLAQHASDPFRLLVEGDLSTAILNSLPGVYYMYDRTGRFLRWNKQFETVTGYTADEIARMHPLDFFLEEDKQRLRDRIENVFLSGGDEVEADFVAKGGSRTPYYFNGVRTEIGGQLCLLGMGFDISTHRRAEQALRETDLRLRQAASAANVGLWDWDLRTNDVFFSAEWKRQLGYEEHEIGSSFEEWRSRVHPADLQAAMDRMDALIANPSLRYDAEFRLRHRNGSYRWIVSQASILFDAQGAPARMLGSHVDVTAQRELERQLQQAQKMEAIGRLAGGVAHDFNNLLTVINGYSELLLARLPPGDPSRKAVNEINRAGERAGNLTRQLLLCSRQDVCEPTVLDLNAIVADTERMLQRLIGADVILTTSLQPGLSYVKADPGHIEQVLMNLAVNARDAMPDGGKLTIATANVTLDASRRITGLNPGDYAVVSVTDTGCGMDEAFVRDSLFRPFQTTKSSGLGIGLFQTRTIVQAHGGQIQVDSRPGEGTTFVATFPVANAS